MNFIFSIVTVLTLFFSPQQGIPFNAIDTAFDSRNAEAIVAHAKEKVMITILGKEGAYSKSQAILVLKDFFSNKSATSFNFSFKGSESSSGTFAIGSYTTSVGKFRVSLHLKSSGNEFLIESITIEKD